MIDPTRDKLPYLTGRNNNNDNCDSNLENITTTDLLLNSTENPLSCNFFISSNGNYQDQNNLLAVYSTMNKLNSNPTMNQQLFNPNSTKPQLTTSMNRLKSNSPLPVNSNPNGKLEGPNLN